MDKTGITWNPKRKDLPFHVVLPFASQQLFILFYKDVQVECLGEKEEAAELQVRYNASSVSTLTYHMHTHAHTHTCKKSEWLTQPMRVVIPRAVNREETHFLDFAFL